MRIFFENKFFEFVQNPSTGHSEADLGLGRDWLIFRPEGDNTPTPAQLVSLAESHNKVAVVCDNAAEMFDSFCAQMEIVCAAGGVVENDLGEVLVMTRKGWPDLPKGHIDPGESAEQAALREVMEETGLAEVEIVAPLCTTRHFHNAYGRWEIKQTEWFLMQAAGEAPKVFPEEDEGITAVEWMRGRRLWKAVDSSYSTIKTLFEKYLEYKIQ